MNSPESLPFSPTESTITNPAIVKIKKLTFRRSSSFGEAPLLYSSGFGDAAGNIVGAPLQSKETPLTRWFVLILSGLILFGNYYAFDLPASLNVPLMEYMGQSYEEWQITLNLCYSVYSFPNMFLPAIGGHLIDHYDPRKVLFVLSFIVCAGQTIVSIGVYMRDIRLIILGRLIFGIGGESVSVSGSAIVTSWFQGKELTFALAMNLCVSRLGSVFNSVLSPKISNYFNSPMAAVWFGTIFCWLSFIAALLLIGIMNVAEDMKKNVLESTNSSIAETTSLLQSYHTSGNSEIQSIREERQVVKSRSAIDEIKELPGTFWILCLLCILLYGTVIPFNATASDFLTSKWYPGDIEMAGIVMSIPDIVSFFVVPFFGLIVDRWGHRITWLLICAATFGGSHLTMGFAYAIYGVVLWPSIATAVQHREKELEDISNDEETPLDPSIPILPSIRLLGTAFGFSMAALNTSLTIIPLISAKIRIQWNSFVPVELFYANLDRRMGSILQNGGSLGENNHDDTKTVSFVSSTTRALSVSSASIPHSSFAIYPTNNSTDNILSSSPTQDEEEETPLANSDRKSIRSIHSLFPSNPSLGSREVLGTNRITIAPIISDSRDPNEDNIDSDRISIE